MNLLKRFCIYGTLFVIVIGTFSHFVYGWSGKNPFFALFCPVNESTWEHMKLLFFPSCLYVSYLSFRMSSHFSTIITAACLGIFVGTFSIPLIFYSYTSILGSHYLLLDILTFILSTVICFLSIYIVEQYFCLSIPHIALTALVLLMFCFFIFTFYPPNHLWFLDPTHVA